MITMTDSDIIKIFSKHSDDYAALAGLPSMITIQKDQPTQQARTEDGQGIYFTRGGDSRHGWPERKYEVIPATDSEPVKYLAINDQMIESQYNISVLLPAIPEGNPLTAKDVANGLAMYYSHEAIMDSMKAEGIQILRITDVRHMSFENDYYQFEMEPNFDIVFTFVRRLSLTIPSARVGELEIFRV